MVVGAVAGFGGGVHGASEIAQGNAPPVDIATRIGAFTVIPNYLITGIVAVAFAVCAVFAVAVLLHRRGGPLVYLALSVALFAVGGGVAFFPCSLLVAAVATRIRKPLGYWPRVLGAERSARWARLWLPAFAGGLALFAVAIAIWLFLTPPGAVRAIGPIQYLTWGLLVVGFVVTLFSIPCGFCRDAASHPEVLG